MHEEWALPQVVIGIRDGECIYYQDQMCEMSIIENSLRCVRPILWEDPREEELSYFSGRGGTGFLVRYAGAVYFVMAKHCLSNERGVSGLRITIGPPGKSDVFLPFDEVLAHEGRGGEEPDYCDLVFFRVALPKLNALQIQSLFPLDLGDGKFILPTHSFVKRLYVRGYPGEIRSVDYDTKKIKVKAFLAELSNPVKENGKAPIYTASCRFPDQLSPGGLSGAPVVALATGDGERKEICLAGMVITAGEGKLRFIGGEVFQKALELRHSKCAGADR